MSALSPGQRIRRWSLWLWLWRVHRWLGLGLGLVIVVVSLSGSLLVAHHELERALFPERRVVPAPAPGAERAALVPIVQRLQAEAPAGFRPLRLEPGGAPTASDKIVFVGPDRTSRWSAFVDPWTGAVLWRGPDQAVLTPWLLHLHMHLHAGKWGYVATGLAAVALTFLGLTGLWITRDRLAVLLRRPWRAGTGARRIAGDVHKWTGLASIYFTLVLGATGVWFAVLIVPGLFRPEARAPLAPPFDLAALAPLEPALATAARTFPDAELARLIFPWDAGIAVQVRMLHRAAPVWEKFSRADFDPRTGALLRVRPAREAGPGDKLASILGPLHFGTYGAAWVKWLYVVGGAMPAVLAATGTAVWWWRRRSAAAAGSRNFPRDNPSVGA